jgi:hypothetical protein
VDAVLDGLRRDPPLHLWLFAQWSKVPDALWLAVILLGIMAFSVTRNI